MRTSHASLAVAAAFALVVGLPGTASAHHRTGTEPASPYAQPLTPPMRGCTTVADPKAPTGSTDAVQVIYAWHSGDGNNYEASYEKIARIVDRIDWALDESSNYDQHIKLSCRYTPNGTYADYARALVVPEQIEAGANPVTSSGTVRGDIEGAGYQDSNRWYLVFTDFESESDAYLCFETGGCSAVTELWDSGVAGHELVHTFGAGHAWMTQNEPSEQFCPDIMSCWGDWWQMDADYNTYYDPSETSASFHIDPYPSTTTWNIARSPALTTPVCCDTGASNDLLTAHERTVEGGTPGTAPSGFTSVGGATLVVTPDCGRAGVSCYYFDGRKSLRVRTDSTNAVSGFALTRNPPVTAGQTYKLFARLRSGTAAKVRLQLRWFNSSGTLISGSASGDITLTSNWLEWRHTATAPTGAVSVKARVVTPTAQSTFGMHVDSLQLNHCNTRCRADT